MKGMVKNGKDLSSEKWTTVKSTFQVSAVTNEKAKRQDQTHYLQYHERIKLIECWIHIFMI